MEDYIELLQAQPELAGLTIEAIPYDNVYTAYGDLQSGALQAIFPIYRDTWYADRLELRNSITVFSQTVDLIFSGSYTDDITKTIAISSSGSIVDGYINQHFPESQIVMYDTWDECIDAVKTGKASSTLMSRYRSSRYLQQSGNQTLRSVGLSEGCGLSFSVRASDVELLSLLNRGIRLMGAEAIDNAVNRYVYYGVDYSFSNFLAANIEVTVIAGSAVVLFLILIFAWYIHITKRNQRRMQKAQDELNEAKNQLTEALTRADFANQSKTKFLFNMSHDIRTPMNAILGFADLLEKHDDNPAKRREYTKNIRTAGGYLLDLINEVLEMARIESGKVSLNEEEGNYLDMVDAVEIVSAGACSKKQQVLTKTVNITHPEIYFDITKERTIFLNVIGNAIKYTPAGGKIDVTVTELPGP
ncbi:MAG: histidine kinase dimerization/phospho-acceptor domain-containing protein [Clostridia bacterium]|nr:histidine kinase dimerization/phospho-acceptor domain-containing protein [Clostridia bacterium]